MIYFCSSQVLKWIFPVFLQFRSLKHFMPKKIQEGAEITATNFPFYPFLILVVFPVLRG